MHSYAQSLKSCCFVINWCNLEFRQFFCRIYHVYYRDDYCLLFHYFHKTQTQKHDFKTYFDFVPQGRRFPLLEFYVSILKISQKSLKVKSTYNTYNIWKCFNLKLQVFCLFLLFSYRKGIFAKNVTWQHIFILNFLNYLIDMKQLFINNHICSILCYLKSVE